MADRGRPVIWTAEKQSEVADKLLAWFTDDESRLFFKTFAHEVYDLSWQALYSACKDEASFSVACARVKEIQEERLALGGLKEKYNAQMTALTLKNVSGWKDKTENDTTHHGSIVVKSSPMDEGL